MTLFSFRGNSENTTEEDASILGMVLLEEANSLDQDGVFADLEKTWNLKITSKETSDVASVFTINGYSVVVASMDVPIPGDEVKKTAEYSYFWPNGITEAPKHKGHVIVSIMNAGKDPIKENILFNQVAGAVLKNSKSTGFYMGGRSLLLKKEFYLANMERMSKQDLPVGNWVYFGFREENNKRSVYTYGLADFGKQEMEIVNSAKSLEDLSLIIYDITHYVLAYDVTLNHGETIGMTAEQKLPITESEGRYLEGNTLKIEY
ncbi:DUF4261 domain-containing protein [Flammeovirga aprica JL-4]|uniref:DUF4261 domain-containing protein n=2 Tax=Flammeovirga aprica TaxID=29528 RepID=A0A7X9RRJ0_9BACT|nr:DUF4261 domain-containing protein [Flammeovirga aprica JL-4]